MDSESVCQNLDWDSNFFGVKIARISGSSLSAEHARRALQWASEHSIECLYFLADAADRPAIQVAEEHHFQLVDIRITLEAQLPVLSEGSRESEPHCLRKAIPSDIPILKEIAGSSHTDSRFYNDPHFPRRLCDELYRVWIEKSCQGYADLVLVAEHQGQPAGYISCHLQDDHKGQIGLVGISSGARNLGLGKRLVGRALQWFGEQGVTQVSVVTQGQNVRGQRLYQRAGFVTTSVALWYHIWFQRKIQ